GRGAPDVDGDVEDRAAHHLDQLALALWFLKMQSAQGALDGAGEVVLDERVADARRRVAAELVGLDEEPAFVLEHLGLDDEHAGEGGFCDGHRPSRAPARYAAR